MSRGEAIAAIERYFDEGRFVADLARRVAIPTESQNPARAPDLARYLEEEIAETLERMGFSCRVLPNPSAKYGPFLFAERIEDPALPTVLTYGHGDVIRGQDEQWKLGKGPWVVSVENQKIYGRGTADNKGQHTINLAAVETVLRERQGKLGFNLKVLFETGEEVGSPGLKAVCEREKKVLGADVLIASDGPRLQPGRPTLFLGSRGAFNFDLTVDLREGGHHSGNWAGSSPTRERSSRTRSRRWSMRAAVSSCPDCVRRQFPIRCAGRSRPSSRASLAVPRSIPIGANPDSHRPSACSRGIRSTCSRFAPAIPIIR